MNAPTVEHRKSTPKIPDSTPPAPATAFDAPERFETRGELGRGGMGRVDDAYDNALGRQVAIKHVLSQADVDLARFQREARITARLEHPGIVPVHDIGRSPDGTPYYIMRRVDGEPLSDLVDGKPLAERLRLVPNMLAACDAAAFAHSRGVVHRDIKPTNILVGTYGETLLIDWGLARELTSSADAASPHIPSDQNLTRAGTVAGTPGFMSPEQARGETVDARADVFALGATLFYVLAGALPWHGGTTEMVDHVGAGRPADWRLLPAEVPPDLRAILEKAMSPDLDVRYADAGALAADLRQFTLGNLVAAYEYGWLAKLARFVRRHRATVLIGALSILVLAIVGIISVRRVLAERDDANAARALAETRQKEARGAADRLLVAHARELVDKDPTEAIAVLRTLSPDSPQWPQAWGVASGAFYRGIPSGYVSAERNVFAHISADNKHAFIVGLMDGNVQLIDLEKRESKLLGTLGRVYGVGWFDATHFVCLSPAGASIFDIARGTGRVIPDLEDSSLYTNRQGRMLFHVKRTLFELTNADGDLVVVDKDIDGYAPSLDLNAAVVTRGRHRTFVTGGKTYPLPDISADVEPEHITYTVQDRMVAAYESPQVSAWRLVDDHLVAQGPWKLPIGVNMIFVLDDVLFAANREGYQRLDGAQPRMPIEVLTAVQTRTGIVVGAPDGRLLIHDRDGVFTLGPRHAHYVRLDQSLDGRMLMAATDTGEVLVWDLSQIRPQTFVFDSTEVEVALSSDSVWTQNSPAGFFRRRFTSKKPELVATMHTPMSMFAPSSDERAIAALDFEGAQFIAAEIGKPGMMDRGVTSFGVMEHGFVYGKATGELMRWQPSGVDQIAKLPGKVDLAVAAVAHFLVTVDDHELVRIDARTNAQEHLAVDTVVWRIALGNSGTVWFLAGERAFRWDLGATTAVELAIPEPPDGMTLARQGAVIHTPRSLVLFEGNERRVIAHTSTHFTTIDEDLLMTSDSLGRVSVVDLSSGAMFELPLQSSVALRAPLAADKGLVGYEHGSARGGARLFGVNRLTVPRDPAKLRAWLATITNAKPIPGSEAVAWP